MSFNSIMQEIILKLTGNPEGDVKYLMEQCENYKNHEYSKEILRALGRLIYDIVPDNKRNELSRLFDNHKIGIEKTMEEVNFQIYQKNYNKAKDMLEEIIQDIDSSGRYSDDQVCEYKCFNNLLEEIIYKEYFKPMKDVRQIPEGYTLVFFNYGNILFELKQLDEAEKALTRALKYSPIDTTVLFELSEIYKYNKNRKKYFEINKNCLNYCYTSKSLGRCYRNLGFYYTEQKNYELAIALFYLSLNFDQESKMAQSELLYISQLLNKQIESPYPEDIKKLLKKYDIGFGANKLILSIAATLAQKAHEEQIFDAAKYFYNVFYDLTGDDEVKKIIESLK